MVDKLGNVRYALGDRRRITDGALVGGGDAATLDGGRGEGRGGVRGQVGLADGCGAIAVPNGPTTARGTHRGRAPTLDGGVLLVPLDKNVPLNTSHVRGDRDLSAGHSGWWMVVRVCVPTYDNYLQTFGKWGFNYFYV